MAVIGGSVVRFGAAVRADFAKDGVLKGRPVAFDYQQVVRAPFPGDVFPCCAVNGFTTATPQQMLAEIKEAATVTVAGPASGPGWTGTRYAFSATLRTGTTLSGTVTVDRQGRTRALVLTQRMPGPPSVFVMTQVLTFSDFGAPVTVTPPPADQTYPLP